MTQIGVAMQQADVAIWQNSYYIQATYCRLGNFALKLIRVKNFCDVKFLRFVWSAKFFNGWWLRCGWAPGEFLMFTLVLPGIGRARYCWPHIVVVLTFTSGVWTCAHTYPLIITTQVFFLRVFNFRSWPIILTAKFSQSTVLTHIQCIYVLLACRPCNANPLSEA